MKFDTMNDLFLHELDMSYDADRQLLEILPEVIDHCSSGTLRQGFEDELRHTQERLRRVDEIYQDLGRRGFGDRCKGMQGILEECREVLQAPGAPEVKDAVLIAGAQKILHYHLSGYGSARSYARELGYNDAADLLQDTLDEVGSCDKKLSKLAEGGLFSRGINEAAMSNK